MRSYKHTFMNRRSFIVMVWRGQNVKNATKRVEYFICVRVIFFNPIIAMRVTVVPTLLYYYPVYISESIFKCPINRSLNSKRKT